ncbi:hypothetical protein SNE40_009045 [Patella caerulea]|uniref:Peptidase M12B domain-containing protein n=1 Tax=Patella caerulea TaxID=87958 RepID=A0AAN8JT76_PATCE
MKPPDRQPKLIFCLFFSFKVYNDLQDFKSVVTKDAYYQDDTIQPNDLVPHNRGHTSDDLMETESQSQYFLDKMEDENDSDILSDLFNTDVETAVHHLQKRSYTNRIDAKIEVLVVVDNSIYRHYMKKSRNKERVALARIRRYYGMVFAMVDQRFQTITDHEISITAKISGIHIAKSRQDSAWLEYAVEWGKSGTIGRVDANVALRSFQKWLKTQEDLPKYDHAIVFTRYLLINRGNVEVGGMAFVDSICKTDEGSSSSIVADLGDFQCVKVATHELGHSLGAQHDGEGISSDCPPDGNYVMAPQNTNDKAKLKNAFTFSHCSVRQMKALLRTDLGKCVQDRPVVHYQYNLERRPPGQIYSASVQCKLIFGKKSGFCNKGKMRSYMCGQLWCKDPVNPRTCRTHSYLTALPGTKCGRSRTCHLGECVRHPNSAVLFKPSISNTISLNKSPYRTRTNLNNKIHRLSPARGRLARPRSRARARSQRKKPENCKDKNETYCSGLLSINPRACRRRQLNEYCCNTCFSRRR